jgi:hypothetical protein
MTDDTTFDIYNPDGMYEIGSDEHEDYLKRTPNPEYPNRNLKGTYLKGFSGNAKGKKKNSKSKLSKQSLVTFLRGNGVEALEMAAKVMRESYKKKDLNTTLRASMFIAGEHIKFIINQEKNELTAEIAKTKAKANEDSDWDDDKEDYSDKVVFKTFTKAVGED